MKRNFENLCLFGFVIIICLFVLVCRFEKERDKRILAHRRAVLRKESEIAEKMRRLREIEGRLAEEREKFMSTTNELLNLQRTR